MTDLGHDHPRTTKSHVQCTRQHNPHTNVMPHCRCGAWWPCPMSKADPDKPCPHENNQATVEIVLLEDTGRRQMNVRAWCLDCEEPFLFPESVFVGVDLGGSMGAMRSLDRQELRIAVTSAADVPEGLDS